MLLAVSAAGAMLWAYGIAVLQPLTEPGSPWWEMAQNNSYWARDLRWGAIVAACLALVVLAGGARWPARAVAAGGLGWVAVDLLMDRADPGRSALVPTLLAAAVLTTAAAAACAWAGRRGERRPRALRTAAVVAVATSVMMLSVVSPSGEEPQLAPTRLVVVALLAVLALVAAQPRTPRRAAVSAAVALLWVLLVALPGDRMWWLIAVSGLLVAGIWWVGRQAADAGLTAAVVAGCAVGTPVILLVIVYATIVVGPQMTALAGNGSLNGDEDMLQALAGVLAGLVVARLLPGERRPAPAPPATEKVGTPF